MTRKATKNLPHEEWLTMWYGPVKGDDPDMHFSGPRRCDRSLMYGVLCIKPVKGVTMMDRSLIDELEARGYDTTTLEFRVKRKTNSP